MAEEKSEKFVERENYKQFNQDLETGRISIIDYHNKDIKCTLFGVPCKKYYPGITGQEIFKNRLQKGLIEKNTYSSYNYMPLTSHLIGSSYAPNPLSIPMVNNPSKKVKSFIEKIKREKIFSLSRNNNILDLDLPMKDGKCVPEYFCPKLADDSPKTRKYLIKLFDSYINAKKEENSKKNFKQTDIKGINNYKKFISNNLTKNLFNGNEIKECEQKDIKNEFNIIRNLIKVNSVKKFNKTNLFNNLTPYNKNFKVNTPKANMLIKNKNKKNGKINLKSFTSKSINKEKLIDKIQEKTTFKKKHDNKITFRNNDKLKPNSTKFGSTFYSSLYFSETGFDKANKTQKMFYIYPKAISDYNQKDIYIPENLKKLNNKNLDLEQMNENEGEEKKSNLKNEKNKKKQILNLEDFNDACRHESELLNGYQSEIQNIETSSRKIMIHNYKSPEYFYKKEFEIFKKVNKIAYQNQVNKNMNEDKVLKKRLDHRRIYELVKIKK